MDKATKKKWVKALRSGKYKQAQEALCKVNAEGDASYCCLGVLANEVDPKGWSKDNYYLQIGEIRYHRSQDSNPNATLLKRVGLDLATCETLAHMNDSKRASFKKIADYIEKNL